MPLDSRAGNSDLRARGGNPASVVTGAEGAGFEPAVRDHRTLVFKTSAFDRSATPPGSHDASPRHPGALQGDRGQALHCAVPTGEVAEWLKALAC